MTGALVLLALCALVPAVRALAGAQRDLERAPLNRPAPRTPPAAAPADLPHPRLAQHDDLRSRTR